MEITAEYVLNNIKEITERCMQGTPVLVDGKETGEWKFEPSAALKGCELLGKHLSLFNDKINHSFDPNAPMNITITKRVIDGNSD